MSPASPALLERVLDADSHEMAPAHFWGPLFGSASGEIADRILESEYINRNVRVTPFNEFEPVRRDFERYPHLSDCYCYSTDYPHVEGARTPSGRCTSRSRHLAKPPRRSSSPRTRGWLGDLAELMALLRAA